MPAGRPTVYQDHYPAKAYEFCLEFAFTDKKLARLFDVDVSTIQAWKKDHSEFSDSIKKGKDDYDSVKIEKSLARRASGYKYTESTKEVSNLPDPKTGKGKMVETKRVRKEVAPDPLSMIFWLKNRQPGRWRDRQEIAVEGLQELGTRLADALKRREGYDGKENNDNKGS